MRCSRAGGGLGAPWGTISLPSDAFEELEPIEVDGRMLRRVRLKGTDHVLTEYPTPTFKLEEVKVQPMPMPSGLIFYLGGERKDGL